MGKGVLGRVSCSVEVFRRRIEGVLKSSRVKAALRGSRWRYVGTGGRSAVLEGASIQQCPLPYGRGYR
jgi:hypothetical protein